MGDQAGRTPAPEPLAPAHCDAVVIGAGIVGAAAARDLARAGLSVALLDKGPVGREQSGRNWGWCRQLGRDRRELPLMRQSMAVWEELQQQADVGFRRAGILRVLGQESALDSWAAWCRDAKPHGIQSEMLDPGDVRALAPDYAGAIAGGVWVADDGGAEPARAAPRVAELARGAGAWIGTECAVHEIRFAGGRVTGVVCERGTIRTGRVLVAAGAWSAKLLRPLGVDLPQAYVLASAMRTTPVEASGPARTIGGATSAIRQRDDGGWSVGCPGRMGALAGTPTLRWARTFAPMVRALWGEIGHIGSLRSLALGPIPPGRPPAAYAHTRTLDPAPDGPIMARAWRRAQTAHPFLQQAEVAERWAGVIDGTPDALPVIGPAGQPRGLWIAAGFSGHGFGLGPGAGRLAAALVAGTTPPVDPDAFRLARFSDGSRLRLEVSY